nr:hypothetical protein [Tanacetum cinerariifolium]
MRILRAWLQPLYNNQQVKNVEMIVMDEHGNKIKCTLWGDYAQQFNDFLNSCDDHGRIVLVLQFAMINFGMARCVYKMGIGALNCIFLMATKLYMKMNTKRSKRLDKGKMCIQNGYWGTKLYLFDGNKAIYEDEYKKVEAFRQRLFANQPSEQSENTATKCLLFPKTPQRILLSTSILYETLLSYWMWNSTVIAIQEDEGWWYLGCRACRVKDETGIMSLSLFNDEVQAMVGRSAYQLNNEATCNTFSAITSLDLESQTDKNKTPNKKQKTNKRLAKGELGIESSTGKKKVVEINVEKDA